MSAEGLNLRVGAELELREVVLRAVGLLLAGIDARPDARVAFAVAKFAEALVHVVHFKTPGMNVVGDGLADALGLGVERKGRGRLIDDGVALFIGLDVRSEGAVGFGFVDDDLVGREGVLAVDDHAGLNRGLGCGFGGGVPFIESGRALGRDRRSFDNRPDRSLVVEAVEGDGGVACDRREVARSHCRRGRRWQRHPWPW